MKTMMIAAALVFTTGLASANDIDGGIPTAAFHSTLTRATVAQGYADARTQGLIVTGDQFVPTTVRSSNPHPLSRSEVRAQTLAALKMHGAFASNLYRGG